MASFFLDGSTGNRYSVGVAQIEYNNKIYVRPTAETYRSLGFSEIVLQDRPDDNFYIVSGPNDDGSYNSTPRELSDVTVDGETIPGLKSQYISKEKATCASCIAPTDWYVIRAAEDSGTAVPAAIATFRAECRTCSGLNEIEINGVNTVAELEALIKAPSKVSEDDGETFVTNPAPHLLSYPEQPNA